MDDGLLKPYRGIFSFLAQYLELPFYLLLLLIWRGAVRYWPGLAQETTLIPVFKYHSTENGVTLQLEDGRACSHQSCGFTSPQGNRMRTYFSIGFLHRRFRCYLAPLSLRRGLRVDDNAVSMQALGV